jgi:Ni/Co efflux regulator RcnB
MSKFWLIGLAASAAWTLPAMAQTAPPPPPPPPMPHAMHAPGAPMTMHGGGHGMGMGMGMHGGHGMGMHRIGRGGMIPPFFMGPQFFVNDWQSFGFPAPMPGGRWIRYYDDALMVDRDGRVMDGRYGWDWDGDGDGDRMAYDDGGYDDEGYDDGDYDRDDDAWADDDMSGGRRHGDREVRVYRHRDGGQGDCRRSCVRVRHIPPPPPPPGYGYGYGYGYGAGCGCGPIVVTETVTMAAPVVETRTYYETVRVVPRRHYARPVRHYSKPVRRAPPPPRPGERG